MQSEELKNELKEIAEILNQFKSEAVQLKVLDMLTGQLSSPREVPINRERKRSVARHREKEEKMPSEESPKQARPKSASRPSGGGAHSVILRLLDEGFFNKAQTISTITKHASERLGHHLKANECSPTLLRLLRSGKLTRARNSDGQYEYSKA
jgi:hypothetical protein